MTDDNATPADAPASEPEPTMAEHHAPVEVAALPAPEEHVALPEHAEPEPTAAVSEETIDEPEAEEPAPVAISEEEVEEPEPEPEPEPEEATEVDADETTAPVMADATTTAVAEPPVTQPVAEPVPDSPKKWYVVKVQSGREESIKAAIERKVKIEGIDEFYGQIAIPVEEVVEKKKVRVKVKDKKTGETETVTQEKNVVKHKKKYAGYLFAEVEFNDRILYLFRETSGVGDFVGASQHRAPTPMTESEVKSMLTGIPDPSQKGRAGAKVKVKLDFEKGDKVRIRDGAFVGSEGEVKSITEAKDPTDTPKVTVVVTIWGRPVELELDYWHVDKA